MRGLGTRLQLLQVPALHFRVGLHHWAAGAVAGAGAGLGQGQARSAQNQVPWGCQSTEDGHRSPAGSLGFAGGRCKGGEGINCLVSNLGNVPMQLFVMEGGWLALSV